MLLQLVLDQPHGHYTNLDIITGRVLLQIPNNTTITFITVKLEGEARTRLFAQPRPGYNEKPRPVLEVHKLLYKVAKVFPPEEPQVIRGNQPNYILQPGQYTYPFQFKLPFNNSCHTQNTLSTNLNFAGFGLEVAKTPTQHVKTTLPPSIYYPGEAEIRYYVKVTVNRPSLLKENPRAFSNITFVPIEPPRATPDGEIYARRQHQFLHDSAPAFPFPERKGSGLRDMFKGKSSEPSSPVVSTPSHLPPARFSIDVRLPNPAILTCGQDIPLRVLVKQLSERSSPLFLQTLQVELIGHTRVRAHDAVRTESNGWVIISLSNLNQPIGSPSDAAETEIELSKEYWFGHRLQETVAPSFVTCNISRSYELVVSIGLAYGSTKGANQFIVLPLRLDVEVYSGIKPPTDLLKRMESAPPRPHVANAYTMPPTAPPPFAGPSMGPGGNLPSQSAPGYDDAPPSYEDAIGQDLPPVDGPRPGYRPPPAPEGESRITGDEKRREGPF